MTDKFGQAMDRRSWLRLALGALAGSSPWALAQPRAVMRVGFISRYKPYSFMGPEGKLEGFDVDVVQAMVSALDLKVELVGDTLSRLQVLLDKGEIDFIGNQLLQTPENRRRFDFVRAYASIQLVAVQHESDDRDFFSLDDMLGSRLGVLANTGVADQAQGALGKAVRLYEHIDQALEALAKKQLDVVLEENLIAEFYIEHAQLPLKVGAPLAAPLKVGWAIPKGRKQTQAQLSDAVQSLVKDRAFRTISTKWFGYDVSRPRVAHASS
jgi:cystine transport system substrate-binding protein